MLIPVDYLYCCQVFVCLTGLVSPEHGLLVFQLDLFQIGQLFVLQNFLSLQPCGIDEDESDRISGQIGDRDSVADRFKRFGFRT